MAILTGRRTLSHWRTGERSRQQAESVALRPANYKDPVQAIANRWLQEKAAAVRRRSPSPVPVRSPSGRTPAFAILLVHLSPPSADPATPPSPASATLLPSRTSAPPSAQSEAYLASQTQLHLPPAPDNRVTKGWGILHQFFINKLNPSDAFEALKSLNCDDALDAEWASVWKRIESIGIGEGINDEQEIQALQTLLDTHDPVYDSAISCDDELGGIQLMLEKSWTNSLLAEVDRYAGSHSGHTRQALGGNDHEDYLSHDDDEVRDILDIVDDYTDAQLDWEQKDLLNYFNLTLRQSELWDKYGVYHVRCFVGRETSIIERITKDVAAGVAPRSLRGAFPSFRDGGLYVRATSLSPRNYPLATYLALIEGFIYPREATDGLRVEEKLLAKKKHPVPVFSQRSKIPIPVHKRIVGWNSNAAYKQQVFQPGTWAIPKKGRYAGDVGIIIEDKINVGTVSRKKLKTVREATSSETATDSSFTAGGYSIPKGAESIKRKRALHSRPPKVPIGLTPIPLFAQRNNLKFSIASCFYCEEPQTCEHEGKEYKLNGQSIINGLAVAVVKFSDLTVAKTISDNDFLHFVETQGAQSFAGEFMQSRVPLPTSWSFSSLERVVVSSSFAISGDLTNEVASELRQRKPSEGVIEEIGLSDCIVKFLTDASVDGRLVPIPHLFLLKKMRVGDEIRVLYGSRKSTELGVAPSLVDERVSLVGKYGSVVHVYNEVDRVDIQFSEFPNLIAFHPNSLTNVSLAPKIFLPERPDVVGSVFRVSDPRGTSPLTGEDTDLSTGRAPWIGWTVKITGNLELTDGVAGQEHKGATGRVVSVDRDDTMVSGLAVVVRLDLRNVPDIRVDYDRVRRSVSGRFLHDNGPDKPPIAFHSHYNFKSSYNPRYSLLELRKLIVDGKRLPDLSPEMAELLRKHLVEQEQRERQKEALEAEKQRCQEVEEEAEQKRRGEVEKEQLRRKRKEDEANRQYVSGRSPLSLRRHTPIPEHWITNPLLRRYNPRGVLEVPVYGYEENREVKIKAGPEGKNVFEYVVKAKGPGGKLPPQMLDEWNIPYDVCSYGFTMPHTCNKLLMIARGPEEHVGHLGRRLYVNVANQIVLQFVRLVSLPKNKYGEEIVRDKEPVAVCQADLAVVPEKADEHQLAIAAIKPLQDEAYRAYMAQYD
ncbi:hypothetical protein BT96DRAFT_1001497 [Gymnopus androsaceus JB14]|uniref:Chromatin elongation factor spt5 n=1 Tax=Gymnopus androsaceus JB14 TaxID=1447944 RepID=A0A6A4H0S8_9AGAR|nr:hypothetical protein BT96DRAFT_1001497 [Gymnopus androsaceus JB14]